METQKTKLTAAKINKLIYSKQQTASGGWPKEIWWDTEITGFGIRVYPPTKKAISKKTFIIEYRINRRKRLKTIGDAGVLTLDQARERAKKDLTGLIDNVDPLADRDQAKEAGTFAELVEMFMSRYSIPHTKPSTSKNHQYMLNNRLLPKFGKIAAVGINHNDLARYHVEVGRDHPYIANRLIELVSAIYKRGILWGVLPKSFQNPAHGIQHFKEEKRDRYLKPEELPRLVKSIDQEKNIYIRNALWLYLLTGMRKNELLSVEWRNVDMERGELKLADTKNGRPHYLPLGGEALELLHKTPKLADNPYVFPGAKQGAHLVNIDKPWQRIRGRAGLDDVRIHDLRRTLGSWLAQSGNSLHLIGRILNHSDQKTTETYARFQQDNLKAALDQHGKQMMGIAGKSKPAEVIPIKTARK